ncbi:MULTISPECIES: DNA topoisomerase IB [unclassified Sphingomonas]|uniref:DNA topoisomerase IB n=1 Tax=unclassified Sphingomonas TaxID=196159 RepID=UPI0006FF360E|nr:MULTISPECIES: DNA topoisomerase IB [unclassified Sphingomonas]KQX25470.1 topoisomerase I [Sphingomonas sp. Root1294]KQY66462.1 topoisomerase I [Sphingomonas sp. Root50]KRB90220.1 topoisomerase I [Sphingomonas sp. Root720]
MQHRPIDQVDTVDSAPGITRIRRGSGWRFLAPDGATVRDVENRMRILALGIPPAWRKVWINPDPDAPVQATGLDAAGRKQYRYHSSWREARDEEKFAALPEFARHLPHLRAVVRRSLRSDDPWERARAAAVRLLDGFAIRVGSADSAAHGSFGATTLLNRHARIDGDVIQLCFYGKHGIRAELSGKDAALAAALAELKAAGPGNLFAMRSGLRIRAADINQWICELTDGTGTAKTFRTWRACAVAAGMLARGRRTSVKTLLEEVARQLGNTPAVCRKSYVAPAFIEMAKAGRWIEHVPAVPRPLRANERASLAVLTAPA